MSTADQPEGTVVRQPAWVRRLLWLGLPLLGAGACLLLQYLLGFLPLRSIPFAGILRLLVRLPWLYAGGLGALLGLGLAIVSARDELVITVRDSELLLSRAGQTRRIERAEIAGVLLDRAQLVVLAHDCGELAREQGDSDYAAALQQALLQHHYRWLEDDPYRADFRRWEGVTDLPPGAEGLLKARARALGRGNRPELAELHGELARLGVIVRDEKKQQYIRSVRG